MPAGKDTDKAFVMALAFQEHGKAEPDDALTSEVEVTWSSDNVVRLGEPISLNVRKNYGIEKRVNPKLWTRHSARAYRNVEAATEALESAASQYPGDQFRIVETYNETSVIAVSKNSVQNGLDNKAGEEKEVKAPEAPKKTTGGTKATPTKADAA